MPNVGPFELIIVLVVALIVLGPKRLPEVGRSLGNGIREFKDSISNEGHHEDHVDIEEAPEPVTTAAATAPVAPDVDDDKPAS
jgi:sec-independent protein translocase protein TatA